MSKDLAADPVPTIGLCQAAHSRLLVTVGGITDEQVRGPSRLPNWTIGHVLTHIARNADGHARRLDGALEGEDLPRYVGGTSQRNADISDGAQRSANRSRGRPGRLAGPARPSMGAQCGSGMAKPLAPRQRQVAHRRQPVPRRLREVEMHHVDLGLGYEPSEWPEEYVEWELPMVLGTVPGRVRNPDDGRRFVAWLSGRSPDLGARRSRPLVIGADPTATRHERPPRGGPSLLPLARSRPVTLHLVNLGFRTWLRKRSKLYVRSSRRQTPIYDGSGTRSAC